MGTSTEIKNLVTNYSCQRAEAGEKGSSFFLRPFAVSEWKCLSEATFGPWQEGPCVSAHTPRGAPRAARVPNTHTQVGMRTQSLQDPASWSSANEETNDKWLFLVSSMSLTFAPRLSTPVR